MNNVMDNNDFDLALEIGELKGLMKGVIERLDAQNGKIETLSKKVAQHEVIFGKIGVIVTLVGTVIAVLATTVSNWFQKHLFE